MAGDWIKFEHTTPDKPEVVRMASELRIDQDAVVGKLLRVWVWADLNSLNGDCVSVTAAFIDRLTSKRGFASAMRSVGWLTGDDGALSFANFSRHNGSTAKGRAMDNRKKTAQRERDKHPGNHPDNVPQSVPMSSGQSEGQTPGPEKRREENTYIAPSTDAAKKAPESVKPPKPPRERNVLLDTMVSLGGIDPIKATQPLWGAAAKALSDIRFVAPEVTPEEIMRRAVNYSTHYPGIRVTPNGLAKHWALCESPARQFALEPVRMGVNVR